MEEETGREQGAALDCGLGTVHLLLFWGIEPDPNLALYSEPKFSSLMDLRSRYKS